MSVQQRPTPFRGPFAFCSVTAKEISGKDPCGSLGGTAYELASPVMTLIVDEDKGWRTHRFESGYEREYAQYMY